uniref:Uncharacterized protein n=1 Tax=Rhizophora mucronata TaxID=61149 RepID=A0A2P2PMJ4_RHIMU
MQSPLLFRFSFWGLEIC